jgi:hypothetical protein
MQPNADRFDAPLPFMTVFVEFQSNLEFLFHWCVCWFDLFKLQRSGILGLRPLVRLCSASKRRVARENMNGKHTLLFNPVLARPPHARSHKV